MKFSILNTIRGNNFTDPDIQVKLMDFWKQNGSFLKEAKEQDKIVAAVYHDYESDYKGDYLVSICKESEADYAFDTSAYLWKEYVVSKNDEQGIVNTWKKIWSDEEAQVINRVYDFDVEKYAPNGEISILIAVQ